MLVGIVQKLTTILLCWVFAAALGLSLAEVNRNYSLAAEYEVLIVVASFYFGAWALGVWASIVVGAGCWLPLGMRESSQTRD